MYKYIHSTLYWEAGDRSFEGSSQLLVARPMLPGHAIIFATDLALAFSSFPPPARDLRRALSKLKREPDQPMELVTRPFLFDRAANSSPAKCPDWLYLLTKVSHIDGPCLYRFYSTIEVMMDLKSSSRWDLKFFCSKKEEKMILRTQRVQKYHLFFLSLSFALSSVKCSVPCSV